MWTAIFNSVIFSLLFHQNIHCAPASKSHALQLSDVLPSPHLVDYSVSYYGVHRHEDIENAGDPKHVESGETFQVHNSVSGILDHAQLMGWDIGVATATNGRGYPNQDNFLIKLYTEPISGKFVPTIGVFAVMDGHNELGHLSSSIAVEETRKHLDPLLSNFTSFIESSRRGLQRAFMGGVGNETDWNRRFTTTAVNIAIRAAIHTVYEMVEQKLNSLQSPYIGTTFTLVLWDLLEQKLYTASAGDSLAFLGRTKNETLELISSDHAASNPSEQVRVRDAMQNYFVNVQPEKHQSHGNVIVVWTTANQTQDVRLEDEDVGEEALNVGEDDDLTTALEMNVTAMRRATSTPLPSSLPQLGTASEELSPEELPPEALKPPPPLPGFERQMALPKIRGHSIFEKTVSGYAELSYSIFDYGSGIFEDFRIGGLQPTRSMGDGGKGPLIDSSSFVRSDPEIKIFDLKEMDPTDFLLVTSDGFTNVHGSLATEKIYTERVLNCKSTAVKPSGTTDGEPTTSQCLENPKQRFAEWYNGTSVFYKPYDDAHAAFSDAVDSEARSAMYKLVKEKMSSASSPTEGAQKILDMTKEVEGKTKFKWSDDITFIVSCYYITTIS